MSIATERLVERGQRLAWLTIGWNTVEGVVAIASGIAAGSVALIGFGVDSYVEVFAGAVIVWRLSKQARGSRVSEQAEHPHESIAGIAITIVSLIVMPILARAKRRVGQQLGSRAVEADATETTLCVWLSAIVLTGLVLNSLFGWWWADPLAGFGIVYVAGREGIAHWQHETVDDCC